MILTYITKCGTADTLSKVIFHFPASRQRAVKCKMALTSQQRGWCVLEFHKTSSVETVQRAFRRKFNVDTTTYKSILKWHRNFIERGCICDQRKGHSGRPSSSQLGHAGYAAESLVRVRLSHRCLPSNKKGAH